MSFNKVDKTTGELDSVAAGSDPRAVLSLYGGVRNFDHMTSSQYEQRKASIPEGSLLVIEDEPLGLSYRNEVILSSTIEYTRSATENTSYYLIRIPKYSIYGNRITPVVRLTTDDGVTLGTGKSDYRSTLDWAKRNATGVAINAGLFKINDASYAPHGRTIIDGVSVTDSDAGQEVADVSAHEVYPLCIDTEGNLSTPFDRDVPTATMIAAGVMQSVTGWGTLILDYNETDDTVFDEQKHVGQYIRQGIGQYQNGDYCILTTDGLKTDIENEEGMTYDALATILIAKGVKFFYSLDGGGSTETVVGDRQVNLIYEEDSGRVVPTVIEFKVEGR